MPAPPGRPSPVAFAVSQTRSCRRYVTLPGRDKAMAHGRASGTCPRSHFLGCRCGTPSIKALCENVPATVPSNASRGRETAPKALRRRRHAATRCGQSAEKSEAAGGPVREPLRSLSRVDPENRGAGPATPGPPFNGDGRRPMSGTPAVTLAVGGPGHPWHPSTRLTAGQGPGGGRPRSLLRSGLGLVLLRLLVLLVVLLAVVALAHRSTPFVVTLVDASRMPPGDMPVTAPGQA